MWREGYDVVVVGSWILRVTLTQYPSRRTRHAISVTQHPSRCTSHASFDLDARFPDDLRVEVGLLADVFEEPLRGARPGLGAQHTNLLLHVGQVHDAVDFPVEPLGE